MDYYNILGLSNDVSFDEIKKAYRKLILVHHPDKNGGQSSDEFIKIQIAYETLSNPELRKEYDFCNNPANNAIYNNFISNFFEIIISVLEKINKKNSVKEDNYDIKALDLYTEITLDELYRMEKKKLLVKVKRENEFISIPLYFSLLNYENKYIFPDLGDEINGVKSDIVVNVSIKKHNFLIIDDIICKYDLCMYKNITLFEYYYGYTNTIDYLNNEKLNIYKIFSGNNMIHVIPEKGLPYYDIENKKLMRGNLLIYFNIIFPKYNEIDLNDKNFYNIFKKNFF